MSDNKISKVTVEDLNSVTNALSVEPAAVEWNGLIFNVLHTIGLEDVCSFVEEVSSLCFEEDGTYRPAIKDFVTMDAIIRYYTDLPFIEDIEDRYKFIYETDIIDFVDAYVDPKQLTSILSSVEDKINCLNNNNSNEIKHEAEELINKFSDISDAFSKAFDGVDENTLKTITGYFDKIDKDKLSMALLKAQG